MSASTWKAVKTLALVGESGCGKSTLARAIMGLAPVVSGSIRLAGEELVGLGQRELRKYRPDLQMVFQNPYGSLNPRLSVGRIVEEPMMVQKIGTQATRRKRVLDLLDRVGLTAEAAGQYPHQFSGGSGSASRSRARSHSARSSLCATSPYQR